MIFGQRWPIRIPLIKPFVVMSISDFEIMYERYCGSSNHYAGHYQCLRQTIYLNTFPSKDLEHFPCLIFLFPVTIFPIFAISSTYHLTIRLGYNLHRDSRALLDFPMAFQLSNLYWSGSLANL